MNRDFYVRPIQGHSRSAHDYGNTRLGAGNDNQRSGPMRGLAIGLPIALLLWAGVLIWWFS